MSSLDEFARECRQVSQDLRRIPAELRRGLAKEVKDKVAEPLAAQIRAQAHGPWAHVLAAGTKARAAADPQVVVGGLRPRLSGGAGPRQVVFGAEFGGGKRRGTSRSRKGNVYKRRTTAQFAGHRDPFVFPTVEAQLPEVLDAYADIVLDVFDREVGNG